MSAKNKAREVKAIVINSDQNKVKFCLIKDLDLIYAKKRFNLIFLKSKINMKKIKLMISFL